MFLALDRRTSTDLSACPCSALFLQRRRRHDFRSQWRQISNSVMGIQSLLPILTSITRDVHLREYANKTVAVDAYAWLHKATFSCAQELCLGTPTKKHIDYMLKRIQMFRSYRVEPFLVFDGGPLPAKFATEEERRKSREEHLASAREFLAQGNPGAVRKCGETNARRELLSRCLTITPSHIPRRSLFHLSQVRRKRNSKRQWMSVPKWPTRSFSISYACTSAMW